MKLFTHKHYAKIIASYGSFKEKRTRPIPHTYHVYKLFFNLSAYNYLKSFKKTFFAK